MTEEVYTIDLVYVGRRWNEKKIVYAYIPWYDENSEAQERWYDKPMAFGNSIGQIWRFTAANEERKRLYTSGPNRPVYLDTLDDPQRINEWTAKEKAAMVWEASARRAKRDNAEPEIVTAVFHLRNAYEDIKNWNDKAAFMWWVQEQITGYK